MDSFIRTIIDQPWTLGAVVIGLVLLQVLLATLDALRQATYREAQRRRSLRLLDLRLQAASRIHEVGEQKSLAWAGRRKFEVRRKEIEDPDQQVCSLYLFPHDGKPIPSFQPGQFLTFQLNIEGQTKPVVRCYSLSDSPQPDHYRVTIKRVPAPPDVECPPGVASNFFHDHVQVGDILDVKAPAGKFVLDVSGPEPLIMIAGGVGITPLLSMLNATVEAGGVREIWLFYCVRHGGQHIMREHLNAIARDHPKVQLQICYSQPRKQDKKGRDYQHAERISVDLLKRVLPSNNYQYYICGPSGMMKTLIAGLAEWGVPKADVHVERFGPGPPKKVAAETVAKPGEASLEVLFARSGTKAHWVPKAGSLLDLARASGVALDSGCERGDCGTCQAAIRSGEVDYLEEPVYECEEGTCLTCCAIPTAPLVLDA